ncbi:fungal-specific transcription factor domain-containing protein [Phascolomyces articulosus]|uniref:Fungal-specific transcription factor domain-containing protein n=1 Tax=Phascolomyces articulosus TaxID=60185 RepID=A0AAD5JRF4_9FUNG|nr:fungal-specific transcription factor domain-containing protein [Phascolomyces articulosus]
MSTDPTPSASSSSSFVTTGSVPTPTSLTPHMEPMGIGSTGQAYYANDCITRMDRIPNIYQDDLIATNTNTANNNTIPPSSSSTTSPFINNNNNKPLPPLPQSPMAITTMGENNIIADSPQPKLHPQTVASTSIQHDLIQLYFMHIHPYLPILHKATFFHQLQTAPCTLLLNAIYAVSARWHTPTRELSNDGHPIGWRYYQAAFSLIDIYTDIPRLSTIQALLLLVKYQEHVRRPGFFWRTRQYFQIIVRMAKDLGIAKAIPSNFHVELIMEEQRRRTFWAVYAYDVLMSTELGTEPHFKDIECTTDYPTLLEDEVHTEEQEVLLHFHWMAKLVHLHGSILHFARQRYMGHHNNNTNNGSRRSSTTTTKRTHDEFSSSSSHTFRSLQQKLDDMSTSMTSVLKPSTSHSFMGSYASSFQYMLLHLSTILLHRPYALDYESSVSAERCTDSASAITHIAETLLNMGGIEIIYYPIRGIQHTIHCLSAAITVHKCLAGIQGHQEACRKSLDVMNRLLESTPAAEVDMNWVPDQTMGKHPHSQCIQKQHSHHNHQHHPQQQQQWTTASSATSVSSLGSLTSLNPSASRSSPILVGTPNNDMMRSKSRRTSLQSLQNLGGGGSVGSVGGSSTGSSKRRSRAGTSGGNTGGGNHSSTNTRNSDRMLRSMVSQHRLSMPILGYNATPISQQQQQQQQSQQIQPSLQHQQPQPQSQPSAAAVAVSIQQQQPQSPISPMSYSQPPSPTATSFYSSSSAASDMYAMTANKPSPFYKQALRSSSVAAAAAAQQQQQQFGEMPTRTTSTPYAQRVSASQRRHTISGDAYQGQLPYPQQQQLLQQQQPQQPYLQQQLLPQQQQQRTIYIDSYQQPQAQQQQQQQMLPAQPDQQEQMMMAGVDNGGGFIYQQQQQQQAMLVDTTTFPMEPNSPMDSPAESMMQLLNQNM